jgi:hypothetical protein
MNLRVALFSVLVSCFALACGEQAVEHSDRLGFDQEAQVLDTQLKEDLELLKDARILFNHQSVGENVINGLRRLSERAGVELRILEHEAESLGDAAIQGGYFLHATAGENKRPHSKIEGFEQLLQQSALPGPDVALMKFCYVDIGPTTDVAALFDKYDDAVQRLQRANPSTTVVHVTVPLTTIGPGWKELTKRFLLSTGLDKLVGVEDGHGLANIKRHEFNDILRKAYAEQAIYDLATIESTRPDGRASQFVRGGNAYPALSSELAADLGHLNALGEELAAKRLVNVIADVLRAKKTGS